MKKLFGLINNNKSKKEDVSTDEEQKVPPKELKITLTNSDLHHNDANHADGDSAMSTKDKESTSDEQNQKE